MDYETIKKEQSDLFNAFPMAFAFNEAQKNEVLKKLKVNSFTEVRRLSHGGIIRKRDIKAYNDLVMKIENDRIKYSSDDEYMYTGFLSELHNYEYLYNEDMETILGVFGLTEKEIRGNDRLFKIMQKARAQYFIDVKDLF